MIGRLFKFHGGIKPDAHKNESAGPAIQRAPLPARLVVPLRQSPRAAATCIVEVGQQVLKGQRIGEPEGFLGTAVHAPTSGTVVDIARHPMAHPSGLDTECVVIEPDGAERFVQLLSPLGSQFCGQHGFAENDRRGLDPRLPQNIAHDQNAAGTNHIFNK